MIKRFKGSSVRNVPKKVVLYLWVPTAKFITFIKL